MTSFLQISINFTRLNCCPVDSLRKRSSFRFQLPEPNKVYAISRAKSESSSKFGFKKGYIARRLSFLGVNRNKDGILLGDKRRTVVFARFDEGFGLSGLGGGGSGGGGDKDDGTTARVLGNLGLAIGLTYLTMTGQLGWIFDALVSIWLLAVLVPIIGLGAFFFWASREIIQDSCPNCGRDSIVFKSTINEDLQLCPFCSQPFSVIGNEFVRDPVSFSNQSTAFGETTFGDFSPRAKKGKGKGKGKGKESSMAVVDVEAEVKDID